MDPPTSRRNTWMSATEHMQKAVSVCALMERKKKQQYFKNVLPLGLFLACKTATLVQRLEHMWPKQVPTDRATSSDTHPELFETPPFLRANAATHHFGFSLWMYEEGCIVNRGLLSCIFLVWLWTWNLETSPLCQHYTFTTTPNLHA